MMRTSDRRTVSAASCSGFTYIELMVSVAIIVLITSIVIFNHQDFSSMVQLSNKTENLALDIRRAQVEGLAVKQFSRAGADPFQAGRGIFINLSHPGKYVYFADTRTGNGMQGAYDGEQGEDPFSCSENRECIETRQIGEGYEIQRICGKKGNGSEVCACASGSTHCDPASFSAFENEVAGVTSLHVSYRRPRPNADLVFIGTGEGTEGFWQELPGEWPDGLNHILGTDDGNDSDDGDIDDDDNKKISINDYSLVRIYLEAEDGNTQYVQVRNTGQINTNTSF